MVIRYSELNKIKKIVNKNKNFSYFFEKLLLNIYNTSYIQINKKINKLYFFRYFFWLYNNNFSNNNFIYFYKYYIYILNYINLIKYLKNNNIKYYIITDIKNLKLNKIVLKKFIVYLLEIKKIKIIFNLTNLNVDNNSVKNLKLINKELILFLMYINFL